MYEDLHYSMKQYYNERAWEYDEIYTLGIAPTVSINDPRTFKKDVREVHNCIVSQKIKNTVLDIPCGTAFWLPSYYYNAGQILLIDQSANMLYKAKERAIAYNCLKKCTFIQNDAFNISDLEITAENVIIGFFLSHLSVTDEHRFLKIIKNILVKKGKVIIIDSVWSAERAKTRKKEGKQIRKLNNQTEYEIFKKYFTVKDVEELSQKISMKLNIPYFGKAFFAAVLS